MKITNLIIRGEETVNDPTAIPTSELTFERSFLISGATRENIEPNKVKLTDTDVVEFVFEDQTVWIGNAETIGDVFPDAAQQVRGEILNSGEFEVPMEIYFPEQERGTFKKILLKIVRIFSKKKLAILAEELVIKLTRDLEEKLIGGNRGLVRIKKDFQLENLNSIDPGLYLLFLHGTAASAANSFKKLSENATIPAWDFIVNTYGENVLAFQYESLSKSPLENVIDLLKTLPQNITLHIISQSGGGLVGDILNRFYPGSGVAGFSAEEKNYLNRHGRAEDIARIETIASMILEKNIVIEKFIRVACPASGSSLATKRLDHLLNTLFNVLGIAIGLAGNPVYIAFKSLIAAVLDTKDDPEILPGVEVLSPFSPLNKMLNNGKPESQINTPLIIIAGETRVALKWNALLVILTRLYYRGGNDFIVDTKSMFNGAKRTNGKVQYFLDNGSNVNHFSYYENDKTKAALLQALQHKDDSVIPGFSLLEERTYTQEDVRFLGLEGGKFFSDKVSGTKPIVLMLPGIMGSNLSVKDDLVWIHYPGFLGGGLTRLTFNPANNQNIKPDSIVKTSYGKLAVFLNYTYDVVTFPFDWRRQLNDCAQDLNIKIIELMKTGQPIKLVGHSMGGVLVRDFIINYPDTWQKLNATKDFRLLFLGSPLGGSFRIPYVLFGQDDIIGKLAMIDIVNSKKQLAEIFNHFPGILSLLPVTTAKNDNGDSYDFAEKSTWVKMRKALGDEEWPIPSDDDLAIFKTYRDKIINGHSKIDYSNAVYVAGQVRRRKDTPCGYRIADGELEFLSTKEGDESVTWETGIPQKLIDDGNVYYSDVTHGALANELRLFNAIAEILAEGKTTLLKKTKPDVRSTEKEFVSRAIFDFDTSAQGVENTLLGLDGDPVYEEGKTAINVSVTNGDLKYSAFPVLAGHFYKDGILNAEKSIDSYLKFELSNRHRLGLYPGQIGTSEIFISENQKGFKGAIITGLGIQGELTPYLLMQTVEQAVCKYLTGFNSDIANGFSDPTQTKKIGISALIIGCGYGGLSIDNAIMSIIQGAQNANEKIRQIYSSARLLDSIEFVELYRDRVLSAMHVLNSIEKDENRILNISLGRSKIKRQFGWRERLPVENSGEWWTRITVRKKTDEKGNFIDKRGLIFTISTDAAREEERFLGADSETVRQLLDEISIKNNWNAEIAKAFFELLIPYDFKDQIKRQANLNWIVDKSSASFPWELLQDTTSGTLPLCVNAGMIRQLATKDYRVKINQVIENTALVIGDPDLKNPAIQLPGAFKEGEKAFEILKGAGYDTTSLLKSSAAQIMLALFSKSYKIVHLAGHGVFNADPEKPSGMLIGKDAFLTTFEVSQMSHAPELVFVNCCYLGQMNAETESYYQDRYKLAANIGTQLIEIGVKAVVVAGWAVDDSAALDFMMRFYQSMLQGERFGVATRKARKAIYQEHGYRTNTWGAYQCYGDPFYTLDTRIKPSAESYTYFIPEQAEIDLRNLLNWLDTREFEIGKVAATIQKISEAVNFAGIRTPKITELEATIYSGLGLYNDAIRKFEELFGGAQSTYSFSATEQYCNVRAKFYIHEIRKNGKKPSDYESQILKVIDDLNGMLRFCKSAERLNILASTYKSYALMQTGKQKQKAFQQAADNYAEAFAMMTEDKRFYPLINWIELENALVLAGVNGWTKKPLSELLPGSKKAATELLEKERKLLRENTPDETSFWFLIADAGIQRCLLQLGHKGTTIEGVEAAYAMAVDYGGHKGNLQAEIDHLEILEDALTMSEKPQAKNLNDFIKKILLMLNSRF